MERIAKIIARSGICSRRDAEKLIAEQRVTFQGKVIDSPALKFPDETDICVDNIPILKKNTKLWLYHKPVGLIVSHKDEQDRETIFDNLPIRERVISVGRLDKNTSGLLLLTNDGELARKLELPSNNFARIYLVRVFGNLDFAFIKKKLSKPITIEGVTYKPVELELEKSSANNHWLKLTISEGKNREIRKIIDYFGLKISKLTRVQYGPFLLGDIDLEQVQEVANWKKILDY